MAHILVIDDESQIRLLLRQMLESEGHVVTDAPDGNKGVNCYRENPADLVIMDLVMPNKDGIETIGELKNKYPDIKIIAMSGGGRGNPDEYLRMAEQLGAAESFYKPVQKEELLKMINDLI